MPIKVINAVYGTTTNSVDVTKLCQQAVASGNDDIPVNDKFMKCNPEAGVRKSFAIIYQLPTAGNPSCYLVKTANENDTLDLV